MQKPIEMAAEEDLEEEVAASCEGEANRIVAGRLRGDAHTKLEAAFKGGEINELHPAISEAVATNGGK